MVATVTGTDDYGVKVKLTSQGGLMGQIKKQDINDSDLQACENDLDKMFRVGQSVSAVITVVDLERIKVNVSVKDEAMDAGLATIIMGAQNPFVPGFGQLKDEAALLWKGHYGAIAHWQVLDNTFDVDACVKDYETVRALQRQRQPKAIDKAQQRQLLYAKETNPNFVRLNAQKALDALKHKPAGSFFIRPSSKDKTVVMHYVFAKG